jgi:hypothetical protein
MPCLKIHLIINQKTFQPPSVAVADLYMVCAHSSGIYIRRGVSAFLLH